MTTLQIIYKHRDMLDGPFGDMARGENGEMIRIRATLGAKIKAEEESHEKDEQAGSDPEVHCGI